MESTLAFLTKRQVQVWFVLDRDERTNDDVARIQGLAGPHAKVHILAARELENYLLSPPSILEFIKLKRSLGSLPLNGSLGESEITAAISKCAEDLKATVIFNRLQNLVCKPIRPSVSKLHTEGDAVKQLGVRLEEIRSALESSINELSEIYQREKTATEELWERRRTELVPGSDLLDCICTAFGVRFNKKAGDGARLAALMHKSRSGKIGVKLSRLA